MCRCAYYLARSLSDLLSVYSDEGHSIVVETSVKDIIVIIVGWNRRNTHCNIMIVTKRHIAYIQFYLGK